MTDIIKAILKINPTAQVSVNANDINQITWHNGTTPISKEDIEAQLPIVELDMAMSNLRAKRNKLLSDTDYLALADNELSEPMKAYRQQLRDLTEGLSTVEEVNAVVFPVKP
jgi:chromosome segregation ATPase